jgi:hypothetical protein
MDLSTRYVQVHLEILGSQLTVSQALPREGGDTFQRGSVERFSVDLDPGQELGEVLAMKVSDAVWGMISKVLRDFHVRAAVLAARLRSCSDLDNV